MGQRRSGSAWPLRQRWRPEGRHPLAPCWPARGPGAEGRATPGVKQTGRGGPVRLRLSLPACRTAPTQTATPLPIPHTHAFAGAAAAAAAATLGEGPGLAGAAAGAFLRHASRVGRPRIGKAGMARRGRGVGWRRAAAVETPPVGRKWRGPATYRLGGQFFAPG